MKLPDLEGREVTARLTTDPSASSYGIPVLVIGCKAHGRFDVLGWHLLLATDEERRELERHGFMETLEGGHAEANEPIYGRPKV